MSTRVTARFLKQFIYLIAGKVFALIDGLASLRRNRVTPGLMFFSQT